MKRLSVLVTMCLVGTMIGMLQLSPAQSALPGQPHIVARTGDHFWEFEAPPWGTLASPTGCSSPGGECIYTHMGPSGAAPGQVAVPGGSGSLSFDNDDADSNLAFEGHAFLDRFGGTRLDDVIDLSYWTHNRNLSTHSSPPYPPPVNTTILLPSDHAELHLWVDTDNNGTLDEQIVFDPDANFATQNPSMTDTPADATAANVNRGWFRWDPLSPTALWYVEGAPGTTFTWTAYINDNLGAKLATNTDPMGFSAGGEGRYTHGHVDNFRMGIFQDTRRYDFEAEATPGADRCHVIDAGCTFTQTYGTPTIASQTLTAVPPALANDDSRHANVSYTGAWVSFSSHAGNLTVDNGPWEDVFQYNTLNDAVRTVSTCDGLCANGDPFPNDHSYMSDQSDDGRYVVFRSDASNLVPGDTNGVGDIFRKDMFTGDVERVNTSALGDEANRWGNKPTISGDGRYVAFSSRADNLVPGDTNEDWDIFVKDMDTGAIERILRNSGFQTQFHEKRAEISGDGEWVTFVSGDSNIVAGDVNDRVDVFRWSRLTGLSNLVSVDGGVQGDRRSFNPSISYFGDAIAFQTNAGNFNGDSNGEQPDIYLGAGDGSGTLILVSVKSDDTTQSNQGAKNPSLGYDGGGIAYVAFDSEATNLGFGNDTNQDRDVFVRIVDLFTPANSITVPYTSGNAPSFNPDINFSGVLAYESHATQLLETDTNHRKDIFWLDVSSPANIPMHLP